MVWAAAVLLRQRTLPRPLVKGSSCATCSQRKHNSKRKVEEKKKKRRRKEEEKKRKRRGKEEENKKKRRRKEEEGDVGQIIEQDSGYILVCAYAWTACS